MTEKNTDDLNAVSDRTAHHDSARYNASAPSALYRHQLHDELLVYLREMIVHNGLPENTKIPEKDLCARFGVSRTPLREALKVLAFEGLVELNHNRGAIVKPLSLHDLDEAFPVYCQLEALAGELACDKSSKEEIDAMMRLHDRFARFIKEDDFDGVMAANDEIHLRLQAASRNRNLIRLLRQVSSRVRRIRFSISVPKGRHLDALAEHEGMMAALEARNGAQLSRMICEHMENTYRTLKDVWSQRQGQSGNGCRSGFIAVKPS